ncbi:MAG: DUF192 domain-containing protein [Chloroflexales bacterium]|nr:DUF192 domain-containing protein [Chloroflexales bacterium]
MWRTIILLQLSLMTVGCSNRISMPTLDAQGTLTGCGEVLRLDIMSTPISRSRGLMERQILPDQYGMLFVFPAPTTPSFWMHDTPIALDIVFLSDDGTILTIESMAPNTDDRHTAPQPVRYALEVANGHFASQSVTVGQQCGIAIPKDIVIQ